MNGLADKKKIIFWEIFIAGFVSYLISFALDRVLLINLREVRGSSPVININRPGQGIEPVFHYIIFAIILIAGIALIILLFRKKLLLKSIGILAFVIIVLFFFNMFAPIAKVDPVMEINGHADKQNWHYYLFVRPVTSSLCWLQDPVPLQIDQNGKWRTVAYFGGEAGQKFELIAIASIEPLNPSIFPHSGSYEYAEIPKGIERFVRVVKHR